MVGHSNTPIVISDAGRVQVSAANTGQTLLDGRVPSADRVASPDALAKLKARAGALHAELTTQAQVWGDEFRAELNVRAGGLAPASVMAEAQIVQDMMILRKAAHILAGSHLGKISEAEVEADVQRYVEYFGKGARVAAGLDVVTKDLLNNARQQANDYAGQALRGLRHLVGSAPHRLALCDCRARGHQHYRVVCHVARQQRADRKLKGPDRKPTVGAAAEPDPAIRLAEGAASCESQDDQHGSARQLRCRRGHRLDLRRSQWRRDPCE